MSISAALVWGCFSVFALATIAVIALRRLLPGWFEARRQVRLIESYLKHDRFADAGTAYAGLRSLAMRAQPRSVIPIFQLASMDRFFGPWLQRSLRRPTPQAAELLNADERALLEQLWADAREIAQLAETDRSYQHGVVGIHEGYLLLWQALGNQPRMLESLRTMQKYYEHCPECKRRFWSDWYQYGSKLGLF